MGELGPGFSAGIAFASTGSFHQQDVPPRGLGDLGAAKPQAGVPDVKLAPRSGVHRVQTDWIGYFVCLFVWYQKARSNRLDAFVWAIKRARLPAAGSQQLHFGRTCAICFSKSGVTQARGTLTPRGA